MAFIFPKKKLPKTGFWENTISRNNSLYPPKDKIEYSLFPFPPLFFLWYFPDYFLMITSNIFSWLSPWNALFIRFLVLFQKIIWIWKERPDKGCSALSKVVLFIFLFFFRLLYFALEGIVECASEYSIIDLMCRLYYIHKGISMLWLPFIQKTSFILFFWQIILLK